MKTFKIQFRVDYLDTDAMAIVHHSRYFRYLERWRVEWMRETGMSYANLELEGYFLPLRSAQMKYLQTLRFDDLVTIEGEIHVVRKTQFEVHYRLYRDGVLTTTATTVHVVVKRSLNESGDIKWDPIRIPKEWINLWHQPKEPKSST